MICERKEPTETPCEECGKESIYISVSAPTIGYNSTAGMKTTDSFNDRMNEIASTKGKDNTIDYRRGNV